MVLIVRCFKCGNHDVRLIVGGRSIIHARCHSCGTNLLEEVMEFEAQVHAELHAAAPGPSTTAAHKAVSRTDEAGPSLGSENSDAQADENA